MGEVEVVDRPMAKVAPKNRQQKTKIKRAGAH